MNDEKEFGMIEEEKLEEMVEEEKTEEKKVEVPVGKAEQIKNSNMPEDQKEKYLRQLGLSGSGEKQEGKPVSFAVYAKVRKIKKELHEAMRVYPKAKGISSASLKEWDEIFKKF